ncbi:MAG: hypothetical protein R3C26_05635 [Calditrichia bacterium]
MTIMYMLMGIAVALFIFQSADLQAAVPPDKLDYMIPQYILLHPAIRIAGILFAAILAAAMSSLDSALNSLSAATMRDFITRKRHYESQRIVPQQSCYGNLGLSITAFAFCCRRDSGHRCGGCQ